ncbi:ribonuclease H-like domain-containing protein [Tanacetum coccineum]
MNEIINGSFKIILKVKVHWICAKELDAWVPKFHNDNYSSDDESSESDEGCMFRDQEHNNQNDDGDVDKLLQKKNVSIPLSKDSGLTYPPGFTPVSKNLNNGEDSDSVKDSAKDQVKSIPTKKRFTCRNVDTSSQRSTSMLIYGGSILYVMDDLVKVGQTIGWDGETVILGDFNEVRMEQERFGSSFNIQGANAFNNSISMVGLIDLPLGGYSYTWSHKSASKMSKLDHFLISEALMALFPHLSDDIKTWIKENKKKINEAKSSIQCKLIEVDKSIDQGGGNKEILNQHASLMKDLNDINSIDVLELSQKAKVCWSIKDLYKMSQPANDEFSQHLSDDEESNHEDASDTGAAPKQKQQKWIMRMIYGYGDGASLRYIDNDAWKVIQNGNSKKRISTGKDGVIRILPPVTAAEIQAVEKERKAKNILLMAIPKEHMRRFHGMDDAKEIWEAIRTRFGGNANSKKMQKAVFKQQFEAFTISKVMAGFVDEVIYSLFAKQSEDWDIEEMDINWQIAMIAIRMKKFYKKTGRRVRVDGKTPVGFDKKKLECFNCHNTGHFARECTAKGTHDGKKKRDSFYQHQEAGKQEKNQMGLLTMDDGIVNWGEHTEVEETNHALMAISSSNEVSLCSKICIDSYNTLKTLCDEQMNQLGDQEAQILAYSQAVKKLEAQLVTFQKQQLSLNEKLTFQANEIYEKDEKLKRYRRIGMKAVKEKEQLQKTLDSWKDSSKNLWRLINSGMSSNNKLGLGYEIQSNNEVLSYEEEMNFSVFNCSKEDSVGKPLYSRFIKTNDFKGVPHPLSGDYTPTPQEEIDESLYVYGKKGPQEPEPNVSDDRSSEYSTCQSNDSARSIGTSSEHSVDPESEISSVPPEVYVSTPITTNEKGMSDPKSKEVEPSCVSHIKTPRQPIKDQATPKVNRKNWNAMMERELGEGYSFTKKKCFVCGSLSHLIKDCDYYEKKMAREAEFKKQRVFNTGNRVAKPVWTNANRVNHANQFVPKPVQLNGGRPNANSVRPNVNTGRVNVNSVRPNVNTGRVNVNSVRSNVNTGRTNVNPVRPTVNTGSSNVNTVRSRQPVPTKTSNSFSPKRPQVNLFNQRRHFSKSHSSVRRPFAKITAQMSHSHAVKENWGSAVKTSAGYNWRNSKPHSNCDSGPTFFRTDHPLKNMVDRGIFDSGCSGHMTGNKDQLGILKNSMGGLLPLEVAKATYMDETSGILQNFIRQIENQLSHRVKIIRSDNGTEFKNRDMLEFCRNKGIKQEYSNARTPQQNGVAERMNRTLIKAARTMLADSL